MEAPSSLLKDMRPALKLIQGMTMIQSGQRALKVLRQENVGHTFWGTSKKVLHPVAHWNFEYLYQQTCGSPFRPLQPTDSSSHRRPSLNHLRRPTRSYHR